MCRDIADVNGHQRSHALDAGHEQVGGVELYARGRSTRSASVSAASVHELRYRGVEMVVPFVHVPRDLEAALRRRAKAEKTTPGLFVQRVIVTALDHDDAVFSPTFRALLGSWEDDRTVEQQLREIR